jgi:hypothetical protein
VCGTAPTNYGCDTGPTTRTCFKTYTGTGLAACTMVMVNAPATTFSTGGNTTYRTFNCKGPTGQTMGSCRFTNCGACGTFTVDMVNGLPVELMEFGIEESSGIDERESDGSLGGAAGGSGESGADNGDEEAR